MTRIGLPHPDATLPFREYPLPSCSACLRIAERKGIRIGDVTAVGKIESVVHVCNEPHALLVSDAGFVTSVSIKDLVSEREALLLVLEA